ncbi:hypothetical protein GGH15_003319 [Coemansia sp. RSA 562]|nr:hypothetical protein GGH15_003319 [Coemansia sp. RSA 562]
MRDTLLFSYRDVAVYISDTLSLREGQWLNDTILGFYFEYLTHEILRGDNSILLLKPALVQLLQADLDSIKTALPPDIHAKDIIFAPIGSGTHWSLLVYCRQTQPPSFHYFDSMANANYHHALAAKHRLELLLLGTQSVAQMVTHSCPQQENSYDCGVFVVLFADLLARRYADLRLPPKNITQDVPRAVLSRRVPHDVIRRPMSPFVQTANDSGTYFDVFRPTALRKPIIEPTFWWIDYGDLFNPNSARATLLNLINKHA